MNQRISLSRLHARLLVTTSAAMLSLAAFGGNPALAQEVYDFDITRADLVTIVTAIARTSGTAVSFPAGLAQGRMAGPIHLRGSAQAALDSALAGSGLEAVLLAGGGLTIRTVTDAGWDGATVEGDVEAIDVTDVSGGQNNDQGFKAGNAGETVRLGDAPMKEIPITVSAVTEDVIKSQSLTTATDAVRNVAGVIVIDTGTTGVPNFQVRGFVKGNDGGGGYTVNGQQTIEGVGTTAPIDSIERVEVLKGPTSILSGATAEGGLVNLVLKGPTEERIRELTTRFGTDGTKSLALDMGGVVPGTDDFTYRFVTSGLHDNESAAGYADPSEFLFFPSVKWTGEDLTVSGSVNYTKQRTVTGSAWATVLLGEDPVTGETIQEFYRIPAGQALGNPDFHYDNESLTLNSVQSYDAGTILGGIDVTFDNTFEYVKGSNKGDSFRSFPGEPGSTIFSYYYDYATSNYNMLTERPSMTLTYEGGLAKSTLKVGYDYEREVSWNKSMYGPMGTIDTATGEPTIPTFVSSDPDISDKTTYLQEGVYAIEKLDLLDNRLHLLGSIRYSWYDALVVGANDTDYVNQGRSYVLGAAYEMTDKLTAYVNHTDGFVPQPVDGQGRVIEPEGRTLYEAGLRYAMLDDRFSITTSIYDLRQTNQTVFDRSTWPYGIILTKGQRSRGLEIEAQGELMPGWNLTASATIQTGKSLDPEYVGIDPSVGNPKHMGSFWTTYTLQEDSFLPGLTFGVGARAYSKSKSNVGYEGDLYDIPGYAVADALVGYERGDFSANLKINNIFDTDAVQQSRTTESLYFLPRRNLMLTARYKF